MKKDKPVSALDVAAYIVEQNFQNCLIPAWKLQKLVYYCQAWALVWDENPLFQEDILAWPNGPVVKELYKKHRNLFHVQEIKGGDVSNLSENQKDIINCVVKAYGPKTSQWLSDLMRMEDPWIEARETLKPGQKGNQKISIASMYEYYSSIDGEPI